MMAVVLATVLMSPWEWALAHIACDPGPGCACRSYAHGVEYPRTVAPATEDDSDRDVAEALRTFDLRSDRIRSDDAPKLELGGMVRQLAIPEYAVRVDDALKLDIRADVKADLAAPRIDFLSAPCPCNFNAGICEPAERRVRPVEACACDPDCTLFAKACSEDEHCDRWCPTGEDPDCQVRREFEDETEKFVVFRPSAEKKLYSDELQCTEVCETRMVRIHIDYHRATAKYMGEPLNLTHIYTPEFETKCTKLCLRRE